MRATDTDMDAAFLQRLADGFWAPGVLGIVAGLAGAWDKILQSETETHRRVGFLIATIAARRTAALRTLFDAVLSRADMYARGGTERQPYEDYVREQAHCSETELRVRGLDGRVYRVRNTCIYLGLGQMLLLITGLLLPRVALARSVIFVAAAVMIIPELILLVAGRRAVRQLHELATSSLFARGE